MQKKNREFTSQINNQQKLSFDFETTQGLPERLKSTFFENFLMEQPRSAQRSEEFFFKKKLILKLR